MKLANTLSAILFCLCTNTALAVCNPLDEITFNDLMYRCVTSPDTDKIWLDRNLGARQVATSSADSKSYGYLYQWGRNDDGHQFASRNPGDTPTSEVTNARSATITPNNGGKFIRTNVDWTTVDKSGAERRVAWASGGANSVCPPSYRVPTIEELEADTIRASTTRVANPDSAFSSFLKLTLAGNRNGQFLSEPKVSNGGVWGNYWSSTANPKGNRARTITLTGNRANMSGGFFGSNGFSVRCIFDPKPMGIGTGTDDPGVKLLNTTTNEDLTDGTRKMAADPNENRTYSVRVTKQPEGNIPTLIVATSNNNAVKINGSTTYSLKFTNSNWSEAQIITIDTACAGENATITHSIIDSGEYDDVVVPNVTIRISGQYGIDINDAKLLTQYLFGTREQSADTTVANIMTCGESSIPDFDLDVDKNNEVNTKDGTLILRHRLGVICPTLTANQTSSNCENVKDAIELLLE